jgi:hypothetical protein
MGATYMSKWRNNPRLKSKEIWSWIGWTATAV